MVALNLIAIVFVGVMGTFLIAERVPQVFVWISIIILAAFAALVPVTLRGFRFAFIICIILATFVIVANTASPAHLRVILIMAEPFNAVILLLGGYGLQSSLIASCVSGLRSLSRG
ncbi:MAG: hypothetical protein ACE5KO_04240 [Candidatus Bathyarchaeia archaeon]